MRIVEVHEDAAGRRIDNLLCSGGKYPKTLIYRLIRKGQIRVNGKRIKVGHTVQAGDTIKMPSLTQSAQAPKPTLSTSLRETLSQAIVYEDEGFLVLDKPAGLASQPGTGISISAIDAARQLRPDAPDINLAHRLDRGTSGCLILCKNKKLLIQMNRLIQAGGLQKSYQAILQGALSEPRLTLDAPLRTITNPHHPKRAIVDPHGKTARTHFDALESTQAWTWVRAEPQEGRMHQIRAHALHLGHPIVGDTLYAQPPTLKAPRLLLHAHQVCFQDPRDPRRKLTMTANIPETFAQWTDHHKTF